MSNRYVKDLITIYDKMEEEDREVENDLMRAQKELANAQTQYYQSLAEMNFIFLNVLRNMDNIEIKEIIKNNGVNPVEKI